MNITKIEILCDDKKVGEITRRLAGVALEPPKITPVVNAEVKHGRVVASTSGSLVDLFASYLAQKKLTNVNAGDAKKFLSTIGRSTNSYSYLLQQAASSGILKKAGSKGKKSGYNVTLNKGGK